MQKTGFGIYMIDAAKKYSKAHLNKSLSTLQMKLN